MVFDKYFILDVVNMLIYNFLLLYYRDEDFLGFFVLDLERRLFLFLGFDDRRIFFFNSDDRRMLFYDDRRILLMEGFDRR